MSRNRPLTMSKGKDLQGIRRTKGHTSYIASGHIGRAIAGPDFPGLDRIMATPGMRRLARSLRSLALPLLVFVVCMQAFEIVLMGLI